MKKLVHGLIYIEVDKGGNVRPTKRYVFSALVKYFQCVLFSLYVLLATYSLVLKGPRVLITKARYTFGLKAYYLVLQLQ